MLGVVRDTQSTESLTEYFVSSPYDNAFVVDREGVFLSEVDQRTWRHFLWKHSGSASQIGEALTVIHSDSHAPRFGHWPSSSRLRRLVPVLDTQRRLRSTNVAVPQGLQAPLPAHGLVMAGGFGRRLGELTKSTPKPMLDVKGKPIAEHLVDSLVDNGITDLFLSVYYLRDVVSNHFGGGEKFGARVQYLQETSPLGTAGCLSLVAPHVQHPLIVVNGDVATDMQFSRLLDFHNAERADITISIRKYSISVPFGVVDYQPNNNVTILEKPKFSYDINVAIYVLSPHIVQNVRPGQKIDMPDFIQNMIIKGARVAVFPMFEDWIDIGSVGDLQRARESFDPKKRATLRDAGLASATVPAKSAASAP